MLKNKNKMFYCTTTLSPLLFNLYINDIFETIANQSSVTFDGNHHLNRLMYADDLNIVATSMEDLQKSLDSLGEYCAKWKLDINYNKTKCMTFTKGTQKKHNFTINQQIIENVKVFMYLA